MAISYVGGVTGGRAGSTSTTTQSLSGTLSGGSDTSPSAGDLVVVYCSVGTNSTYAAASQTISGNNNGAYDNLTFQSQADTYYSQSQLNYKIQGGTVDTSLTIPSSGNARNAQRWVVHVFRGVRSSTPLDVTSVPASGANTGRPDPGAITPSTTGAWIVAFYASAAATGAAYTAPSELTDWLGNTTADTYDCMQGAGYYTSWSSGAYNPQAITAGGTTGTGDSWTAMTIALRPEFTPTVTLDDPTAGETVTDTTPDLLFTGTDGNSDDITYQLQVDTATTFDSQGGTIDSCSESNYATDITLSVDVGIGTNMSGQSITGNGGSLTSVKFYLKKSGTLSGTMYAKLYAHTGTYGTSSIPTGSALATSDGVAESSLTTSYQLIEFTFSTPYTLSNGTYYVIIFEPATYTASNYTVVGVTSASVSSGNSSRNQVPTGWAESASEDLCFYAYSKNPLINALSASDAGFARTSDSDPFASGGQVTYTVQSALSNTTYYWRVRGKDSSGSNTWGAWSTGAGSGYESFVVSSGVTGNNNFFLFFDEASSAPLVFFIAVMTGMLWLL